MPAKSRKQLKYIFAMRKKYGSKDNAPESKQWVFNSEWQKEPKAENVINIKDFKSHSEND